MSLKNLRVTFDLKTLKCLSETDEGAAEPYMATVFFRIDGQTVTGNTTTFNLEGFPLCKLNVGDQKDFGTIGVTAGGSLPIPPTVGHFVANMKPIKLGTLPGDITGFVGCVIVLMEQDNSSAEAINSIHDQFNDTFWKILKDQIPLLDVANPVPTPNALNQMATTIKTMITNTLGPSTLFQDKDDVIGVDVFLFTHAELSVINPLTNTPTPINFEKPIVSGGDSWNVSGTISAQFQ